MKIKYNECKECKEEKAIYSKKCCQNCYWKLRRKANEAKKGTGGTVKNNKRYKIKPISNKMAEKLKEYRPLRDKYMKENPTCEVLGCYKESQDLHHKARRGANLCNVETFMAVCRTCHISIEENPIESKKLGYLM